MEDIGGQALMYFIRGGWVMYILLFFSIAGLVVVFERGWALYFKARSRTAELVTKVRKPLRAGKADEALKLCEEYKGASSAVIKAALVRWDSNREELEKMLENAAIHEIARLERGVWLLAVISNVAPIVGFLGTVVGMINSFDVLATQGLNNPGAVAAGISQALITTAGGLIVAVMTLPFYNFYQTKIGAYIREMETMSNIVLEIHEDAPSGN